MLKIGGSRGRIRAILASEVISVLIAAVALALLLTTATSHFAAATVRVWLAGQESIGWDTRIM